MTKRSSETSSLNGPDDEPVEIPYKRWKHKTKGYIVTVYAVRNYQGAHGFHSVVIVHDGHGKAKSWVAKAFLETFEPIGRKMKVKRWWERI